MGNCSAKQEPKPHRPPPTGAAAKSREYKQYELEMAMLDQLFDTHTQRNSLQFQEQHRTVALLHDVVDRCDQIDGAVVAEKVEWYISHYASDPEHLDEITTLDVFNVVVNHCGKYAASPSEPDAANHFLSAVANLTGNNPEGQKLFSNAETVAIILKILDKIGVKIPEISVRVASTIINFAKENEVGQHLLSSSDAVHSIVAAFSRHTDHIQNSMEFTTAIVTICEDNLRAKRAFSTPQTVSAILAALKHVRTDPNAQTKYPRPEHRVRRLCKCIRHIIADNPEGLKVFATSELIKEMSMVQFDCLTEASSGITSSFASSSYEDEFRECLELLNDSLATTTTGSTNKNPNEKEPTQD